MKAALADLRLHSAMRLVPDMREDEFASLLADVRERGVVVPVEVADDGMTVLDGRHRIKAARQVGLSDVPIRKVADGDARDYVLKAAVLRRHLTDDQRAAMAAMWARANPAPKGGDRRSLAARAQIKRPDGGAVDRHGDHPAQRDAATRFNVTPKQVEQAAALAKAAPELARQVHAGDLPLREALREAKIDEKTRRIERYEIRAALAASTDRFNVVVADPPWPYTKRHGDPSHEGRVDYPTMSEGDILALKIPAASDCVLWLWTTNAFMPLAVRCVDAWGFTWKTILTWDKDRPGLGEWLLNQTEHCVLATRGKPVVKLRNQTTILRERRAAEHSRKPDGFYDLVEAVCVGSRCELFGRRQREGWTAFGELA